MERSDMEGEKPRVDVESGRQNAAENGQLSAENGQRSAAENGQLNAENERLRARLAALEEELVEVQSRTNAAIAKWQEQAYWLDRWHLDLNALMRRPGAVELLGGVRAVRSVWWRVKLFKRRLLGS